MSLIIKDINSNKFKENLEILGLNQSSAAAMLQVAPRTVRRWQNGEQPIPGAITTLVKAWRQLEDAKIPWAADIESIWHGDEGQIRRNQDHALVLAELLRRVESRGGVSAPWRISLKELSATLGPMTVRFYALTNGGFSLANYCRSDMAPDTQRDWRLIEEAVAAFASAVSKAREQHPEQRWHEVG